MHDDQEFRSFAVELRVPGEGRTVEGYAALHGSVTDMGWYDEVIEPGAFAGAKMDDVRCLFNHDPSLPLARTKANTLTVTVDEKGLFYRFEMPNTVTGNDLLENIKLGNVSQSSFAFRVKEQTRVENYDGKGVDLRRINKIEEVFDVSPVTYAAYEDTDVVARSWQLEEKPKEATPPTFDDEVRADIEFHNQLLHAAK